MGGLLAENAGRWESVSERDLARIEALARSVVTRLLHEPTLQLKARGGHARIELTRELFGLGGVDEGSAAPPADAGREPGEVRAFRQRR